MTLIISFISLLYVLPVISISLNGLFKKNIFVLEFNPIENLKLIKLDKNVRFMYFIGLFLFAFLLFIKVLDMITSKHLKNNGEHGTARFLTRKEFIDGVTAYTKNQKNKIGGLIICNDFKTVGYKKVGNKVFPKEKPDELETYYVDTEDKHTLIIGTTRSGKTRRQVIPSIYAISEAKESLVINDLKGELFSITSGYLKKKGYKVIRLDFREAKDGNRYNFLSPIYNKIHKDKDISKAEELSQDMAHALVYREKANSSDPVWQRGEKSVLSGLIMLVAMYAKQEEAHMYSVYNNLVELGQTRIDEDGYEYCEINRLIDKLPPGHPVKRAMGTAIVAPTNMRTSFYSSALANLEIFSDPSIAYLTGETDHDLKSIGKQPTVVYITVPDEKETRHVMTSLYVDQLYAELVELANEHGGRLPNRVHYLLDEFGNMPQINNFKSKMTIAAGRGMLFHLFIQDLGQLNDKYGKEDSIIKGNCHNWTYLLTTDVKTAEEISKKAGSMTIKTKSESHGQDKGSVSVSLTKRPLLTPDEILRFKTGEVLLLRSRQQPYIAKLMDYSNYKFAKRMGKAVKLKEFDKSHPIPVYIAGKGKGVKQQSQKQQIQTTDKEEQEKPKEDVNWESLL